VSIRRRTPEEQAAYSAGVAAGADLALSIIEDSAMPEIARGTLRERIEAVVRAATAPGAHPLPDWTQPLSITIPDDWGVDCGLGNHAQCDEALCHCPCHADEARPILP
jgi:hypothetical protein